MLKGGKEEEGVRERGREWRVEGDGLIDVVENVHGGTEARCSK